MSYLYPYGDTQQLNLSWFLAKFKELYEYISNLDPDDIAVATVLSRFTNEYNSSTNYIPGDYTIHEGFIYKANQSTTGNFNPEAWDAALPVNDIQGLRILLGGLSTDLTALEQNAITNVQYTPGAASADGLLRQTKNGTAETVMTVDKEPTANSQNPVKSGAVQAGIAAVSQAVGSERTDRQNADTSLQHQIDDLNDKTGDGSLTGFTATDLTGAANELKGSLNTTNENLTNNFGNIATVESLDSSTTYASRNYSQYEWLIWHGYLVNATTNIAKGEELIYRTNIASGSISTRLYKNAINKTGKITPASGFAIHEDRCVQRGNVCEIHCYIDTSTAFTGQKTLAEISGIALPPKPIRLASGAGNAVYNITALAQIYIGTNGQIIATPTGSITAVLIDVVYTID